MNEEQIKKMIADDFDNFINERLDSAIIFKYISNLEKENLKLKEQYCERTDCSGRLGNSKKVEKLEEENQQLKEQLQQKEDIINKTKDVIEKMLTIGYSKGLTYYYPAKNGEFGIRAKVLLEILDNKGE